MTNKEIWTKLQSVFTEIFDDESLELTRELSAEEVEEWDSLTHVILIVHVEREFGIKFLTGEVENTKNVGQFADLIASKLAARP